MPPGGMIEGMNPWILQMGYPVVYVERDPTYKEFILISQKRFLLDPSADIHEPESPYG